MVKARYTSLGCDDEFATRRNPMPANDSGLTGASDADFAEMLGERRRLVCFAGAGAATKAYWRFSRGPLACRTLHS
ncbi:protein of unknown function [Bradyrhizobium vignae]|uniref:Uncharacterized protein n=1 Tax=Bradyrhizobium vignae TaxID=1549949 RepID=A0A2U3Q0E9_9BRAD|nr:protein of unknown function [Bradyrhizobium vignae]